MNVSVFRAFGGPIRCEVIGVFAGKYFHWVRVKSISDSKVYPRGYVFDAPYADVYNNHRFIRSQTEYTGRPRLEDMPIIEEAA